MIPLDLASFTHHVPNTDTTIEVVPLSVANEHAAYAVALETALKEICLYTGEGPRTTPWQAIVKDILAHAHAALAKNPTDKAVRVGAEAAGSSCDRVNVHARMAEIDAADAREAIPVGGALETNPSPSGRSRTEPSGRLSPEGSGPVGVGPHPESKCERCGGPNFTWFAPNEIWNAVMPDADIVCPVCFTSEAALKGFDKDAWRLAPEFHEATIGEGLTLPCPACGWKRDGKNLGCMILDARDLLRECSAILEKVAGIRQVRYDVPDLLERIKRSLAGEPAVEGGARVPQDAFNHLSRLHGEARELARSYRDTACRTLDKAEIFARQGKPLPADEIAAMTARIVRDDKKLDGEGRKVPPHRTGPTLGAYSEPPATGGSA